MQRDGVCKVREGYFTKTIEYEDINYSVASVDDQAAIFDGYCGFLNYFDSALPFQMSFVNHRSRPGSRYRVNIPRQNDEFNSIRGEFTEMLKNQIAKSNNGIMRSKYITFGVEAEGIAAARPRLERVEAGILSNFKKLVVEAPAL
ncbi:MAG: conjugal transfer protein TraE, partial [Clostridiales bacterium]|nr:conjugal transfer protein TraE [Clostridiales bacterium]